MHVQPRASRPGVAGLHGDAIKVRVAAPPLEGKANDALAELLAQALGVGRRAVHLFAGTAARDKIVEVSGVTADDVRRLVPG